MLKEEAHNIQSAPDTLPVVATKSMIPQSTKIDGCMPDFVCITSIETLAQYNNGIVKISIDKGDSWKFVQLDPTVDGDGKTFAFTGWEPRDRYNLFGFIPVQWGARGGHSILSHELEAGNILVQLATKDELAKVNFTSPISNMMMHASEAVGDFLMRGLEIALAIRESFRNDRSGLQ